VDGWWQQNLANPGGARAVLERATHGQTGNEGRRVGEAVLHRLTSFAFTLLTLFFLFREGHDLTRQLRGAARRRRNCIVQYRLPPAKPVQGVKVFRNISANLP